MDALFDNAGEAANDARLKSVVEALLFVSKRPVTLRELRSALAENVRLKESEVGVLVEELKIEYLRAGRGFRITEVGGGYQLRTAAEFAPYIVRFLKRNETERLSQPALETLAIIAYHQPIVRQEIEAVRGVDVGAVLKSLYEKNLIRIVGRKEVPGRPFLYETTPLFLEHFGLKSLEDLPRLAEIRPREAGQEKMKF